MIWLIAAYFIGLCILSCNHDKWQSSAPLADAWRWFGFVFFVKALFTLVSAGCDTPKGIMLAGLWGDVIAWVFLGMSIIRLSDLFYGDNLSKSHADIVLKEMKKHDSQ